MCPPAQQRLGVRWVCKAAGNVTGTPRSRLEFDRTAAGDFEGTNYLENAIADPSTQISGPGAIILENATQRGQVPRREVYNMDVVAHPRTIPGRSVIAKHR